MKDRIEAGGNRLPVEILEQDLRAIGLYPSDEQISDTERRLAELKEREDIANGLRGDLNEVPSLAVTAYSAEIRLIRAIENEMFYFDPRYLGRVIGFAKGLIADMTQQFPKEQTPPAS